MKVFDSTTSIGKMFKHIFNLIVLAALFAGGYKFGVSHDTNDSPYMYAYALPSLVAGLVFCKRFSDNVWMYLHPNSVGRVNVYHYNNNDDPAAGILGIILKYVFYMFVGFVIFPLYCVWAVISILWLAVSAYRHRSYAA